MPLSLWGAFSYFPTSKPSHDDLVEPEDVHLLAPTHWNPHLDHCARNEEAMLDWEGNVMPKKDREQRLVLEETPDGAAISSLVVDHKENEAIDAVFDDIRDDEQPQPQH